MASIPKDIQASRSASSDGRRELVRRVVSSSTFVKSKRLSSFLYYICEETLNGRSSEINEQRIGEEVFGRSRDFDSSIDGIVRTQGSRLRQRLDRYFSEEGVAEPVRIVIPRGGYVPVFEPRFAPKRPNSVVPVTEPMEEERRPLVEPVGPAPATLPSQKQNLLWLCAAVAVLLMTAFAWRHFTQNSATAHSAEAMNPLWRRMFAGGKRTLIVPGDSGLVIWEGLTGQKLNLAEFLRGDYHKQSAPSPDSPQGIADDLSKRRYTTLVDMEVLQFMSTIAQSNSSKLDMRYARDLKPNDLKEGNIILVGANEANPWVELYEPLMQFTFFSEPANKLSGIVNRSPKTNEPQRWDMGGGKAYAIVAFLPGLTGKGDSLIIGGTSMTGTESALDFVSDNEQLLPFLRGIQRPDGRLPHFQLVLGTNGVTGNAVRSQILASRITD